MSEFGENKRMVLVDGLTFRNKKKESSIESNLESK